MDKMNLPTAINPMPNVGRRETQGESPILGLPASLKGSLSAEHQSLLRANTLFLVDEGAQEDERLELTLQRKELPSKPPPQASDHSMGLIGLCSKGDLDQPCTPMGPSALCQAESFRVLFKALSQIIWTECCQKDVMTLTCTEGGN